MTSTKKSEFCECPVILPKDVLITRCINGKPKHKTCGGIIKSYVEKRVIEDDRPGIEYR
jgi:hypothetical protein